MRIGNSSRRSMAILGQKNRTVAPETSRRLESSRPKGETGRRSEPRFRANGAEFPSSLVLSSLLSAGLRIEKNKNKNKEKVGYMVG